MVKNRLHLHLPGLPSDVKGVFHALLVLLFVQKMRKWAFDNRHLPRSGMLYSPIYCRYDMT